jgi:hypothetical protein
VITAASYELLHSGNAEDLLRNALIESAGPAIDKVMFSTSAAGAGPAGLLAGIAPLTAAAAGGDKASALVDDLQKIATAFGSVTGNSGAVLIAAPAHAVALRLRLLGAVEWPVLTSASLAAGTVIGVATRAVVSAVEGAPQIDAGREASVHWSDSAPADIVGSGGAVASPVGNVFQKDSIALRLRWPITWGLRSSSGIAWMQNVNW